jgi:hypothetical protein
MDEKYQASRRLEQANAELAFHLRVFGDHVAQREGYKVHQGFEALHFYIVEKYKWLPSVAKSLSNEDLRFLLEEEMSDWVLPGEAR